MNTISIVRRRSAVCLKPGQDWLAADTRRFNPKLTMTFRATFILVLTAILASGTVRAAILSTSGTVSVISPPADVSNGVLESNTVIGAFAERQNVTLTQGVAVDISVPGTSPFNGLQNLSAGIVPSGSEVSSYFVHFDAVGSPQVAVLASGSITLSQDILGLIVLPAGLEASNATLGLPGTAYDNSVTGLGAEGLEIVGGGAGKDFNDQITLSADRHTVTFNFRDGGSPDDFRVITSVPEPSTFVIAASCGMAAILCALRRRHGRHFSLRLSTTVATLGDCNAVGRSAS